MIIDSLLLIRTLLFPGLVFMLGLALFIEWFERRIAARMQNRVGPNQAGPGGVLQPIADFIKLLLKEEQTPEQTNHKLMLLAPIFALSIPAFTWLFIPIDGGQAFLNSGFEGDLLLLLSLMSLGHFALFLSGWSSNNPYGMIGGSRVLVQFVGYDIPLVILAAAPCYLAGSLSITEIISTQVIPFGVLIPWVFILFLIVMAAELEEPPFDTSHAETEIVGGLGVEYSGAQLAFLELAHMLQEIVGIAITVILFLGGAQGPVFFGPPALWGAIWFVAKMLFVTGLLEIISATAARFRIDQIVSMNWRFFTPLAIGVLILTIMLPYVFSVIVSFGVSL